MTTKANLVAFTIDCDDPVRMAEFWSQVTGLGIQVAEPGYSAVSDGGTTIYFGRIPGYRAPAWPSDDKQFHLDFRVPDVAKAVEEYEAMGATRPDFQPGDGWVVMQDPEGHLFCVCPERSS
ncbi:VOC family protein [Nonomuraea sp. NPDC003804]|uniref:VOC family protein n=1 Tax=Nonomuraea sp. NPDC003804 TaxID=3154547 RepID=UPI0033B7B1AC